MKRILVTGAGGPAGVNFIRSLRAAEEPYYIVGTDVDPFHLEWPQVDAAYVAPTCGDPHYIDFLHKLIDREGIEFIHPQPDAEVRFVSENREHLRTKVFLPHKETIRICQDKYLSGKIWSDRGILRTKSVLVQDRKDLEEAAEILGLPFWLRATRGAGGIGSTPVEQVDVAFHWMEYWRMRGKGWDFVAQEMLPGRNLAFTSLWKQGHLVCSQVRERLEYIYPYLSPSGITGTPALAVTRHRPDVNRIATEAVLAIDPLATGVFSVDLKEDVDGIPRPTEINCGRFFTTSYFFTEAGVNIPHYYVKLAFDEPIPDIPPYDFLEEGLYWIRHIDCPAALRTEKQLRARRL